MNLSLILARIVFQGEAKNLIPAQWDCGVLSYGLQHSDATSADETNPKLLFRPVLCMCACGCLVVWFLGISSWLWCRGGLGWAGLVHVTPEVIFIYWSNIWPEYDSVSDLVLYIGFGCTKCTEEYHCHYWYFVQSPFLAMILFSMFQHCSVTRRCGTGSLPNASPPNPLNKENKSYLSKKLIRNIHGHWFSLSPQLSKSSMDSYFVCFKILLIITNIKASLPGPWTRALFVQCRFVA